MKKLLTYPMMFLLFAAFLFSCKQENNSLKKQQTLEGTGTDAIITGFDARMCPCCGGLMINFEGNPNPNAGNFKLISNPSETGIGLSETFPVYVKVDWEEVTGACNERFVKIIKLVRR